MTSSLCEYFDGVILCFTWQRKIWCLVLKGMLTLVLYLGTIQARRLLCACACNVWRTIAITGVKLLAVRRGFSLVGDHGYKKVALEMDSLQALSKGWRLQQIRNWINKKTLFNFSSKILCHVVNIELKAEHETDEVYAQISLIPEKDQDDLESTVPCLPEPQRPKVHSFCKILTASDTSTHGGFSVLRKHANECLPPLNMSQPTPTQELVAKDLHGYEWHFKHIYRGQPRRHLLTTGWSTFVSSKRLVAGDAFIFLRGDNGDLQVGVRRLVRQQTPMPSSVISSQSMHLGVLATARHAVNTSTMFTVYYKPRSSQFIVGVTKFLEAMEKEFFVGMRFDMKFEGEDTPERRFTGTIVGVEDVSPQWSASKWRSLKVQWDEATSFQRPDRVSPWEIEPLVVSIPVNLLPPPTMKAKRSRPNDLPLSASRSGHDYSEQLNEGKSPGSCRLFGIELRNSCSNVAPTQEKFVCPGNLSNVATRFETAVHKTEAVEPLKELNQDVSDASQKETQSSKQISSLSTRSRTKVQMQGVAVGRAVDLTIFDGCVELIRELERMFEIKGGELQTRSKWFVVFTDDKDEMMLVGDDPWKEFCKMVRKIFICSSEEVKKMTSKSSRPSAPFTDEDSFSPGNRSIV